MTRYMAGNAVLNGKLGHEMWAGTLLQAKADALLQRCTGEALRAGQAAVEALLAQTAEAQSAATRASEYEEVLKVSTCSISCLNPSFTLPLAAHAPCFEQVSHQQAALQFMDKA